MEGLEVREEEEGRVEDKKLCKESVDWQGK